MKLSAREKLRIVQLYYGSQSYVKTRRAFCLECGYTFKKGPSYQLVVRTVKHFEEFGTIHNINKNPKLNKGRIPVVSKNTETIETVRQSLQETPKKSLKRRALDLDLSPTTLQKIVRTELKAFPYKISVKHALTPDDKIRRVGMCRWIVDRLEQMPNWINDVWFSDETHFHLNGAVNNHNNIYWGTSPPEETTDRNLKGQKVTCFVAFNAKHGIIGPYWFEEEGKTVTINAVRYRDVIRKFDNDVSAILSPNQRRNAWFMQDGAPPHTAHATLDYLKVLFQTRLLALGTDHPWSPHSPDLNPLDFWLWGAAKDVVYKDRPVNLNDLKTKITEYIQQISPYLCKKVGNNFTVRMKACLKRDGGHIEHINYRRLALDV